MRIEQVERRMDVARHTIHETSSVTFLDGDRKRVDSLDRLKDMGGALVREVRRVEIIRLDKHLLWRFDKTAGTWSEESLGAPNTQGRSSAAVSQTPSPADQFRLRRTEDRKEINGHESERFTVDGLVRDGDGSGTRRLVGEIWATSDIPEVQELVSFDERSAQLAPSGSAKPGLVGDAGPLERLEIALSQIRRWLMRSNRYPVMVEADLYHLPEGVGREEERLASIRQETKGVHATIVFCSCTDHEKLFEFWGSTISLQIPLFQQRF